MRITSSTVAMESLERFARRALDVRKAPDSAYLHGWKSIRLRRWPAAGIATRLGWQPPECSRQSQDGDWVLVEKEAATGGEGNWFAKQGLRAHNLGRRRALAVTKISRYSSLNACALHSSVHSPEPLDEFAFHRWGGLVCIVTSVSLRSRRTSFFFADPRWWRLG